MQKLDWPHCFLGLAFFLFTYLKNLNFPVQRTAWWSLCRKSGFCVWQRTMHVVRCLPTSSNRVWCLPSVMILSRSRLLHSTCRTTASKLALLGWVMAASYGEKINYMIHSGSWTLHSTNVKICEAYNVGDLNMCVKSYSRVSRIR